MTPGLGPACRRCTELKPGWAKGWSRLGAAYFGLEQFSEVGLALVAGAGVELCGGSLCWAAAMLCLRLCLMPRSLYGGFPTRARPLAARLQSRPPSPPCPSLFHLLRLQAREAYERACKLEPSDSQLQVALQRASAREAKQVGAGRCPLSCHPPRLQCCWAHALGSGGAGLLLSARSSVCFPQRLPRRQIAEHKHTFHKREREEEQQGGGRGHEGKRQQTTVPAAAKKREKTLLSFGADEEEG